jgi:hypothetical protein
MLIQEQEVDVNALVVELGVVAVVVVVVVVVDDDRAVDAVLVYDEVMKPT